MPKVFSSIACNLDAHILQTAIPLFEAEKVEAIEWSFDTLFKMESIPDWFEQLLMEFSDENRLIGHGVFFSLFSGKWLNAQQNWLIELKKLSNKYRFNHITEHFGFMTGEDFHKGAPISIPFNKTTLNIGIDRLKRIQNACNCPVGLENLAFSYSIEEVKTHGDFLNELIEPINGFIILDLHNFYCQLHNFDIDFQDLMAFYPLDRVREIHISGGSFEPVLSNPTKEIRRDTHDDSVPETVFNLLKKTIPKCPNLKFVVLEQLGVGLQTIEKQQQFQQDFMKMEKIVQSNNLNNFSKNSFLPKLFEIDKKPIEDKFLYHQQIALSKILENAKNLADAQNLLAASVLANSDWKTENWQPEMLETAISIAQKWKNG
jgi:uncharacterized protein